MAEMVLSQLSLQEFKNLLAWAVNERSRAMFQEIETKQSSEDRQSLVSIELGYATAMNTVVEILDEFAKYDFPESLSGKDLLVRMLRKMREAEMTYLGKMSEILPS